MRDPARLKKQLNGDFCGGTEGYRSLVRISRFPSYTHYNIRTVIVSSTTHFFSATFIRCYGGSCYAALGGNRDCPVYIYLPVFVLNRYGREKKNSKHIHTHRQFLVVILDFFLLFREKRREELFFHYICSSDQPRLFVDQVV